MIGHLGQIIQNQINLGVPVPADNQELIWFPFPSKESGDSRSYDDQGKRNMQKKDGQECTCNKKSQESRAGVDIGISKGQMCNKNWNTWKDLYELSIVSP